MLKLDMFVLCDSLYIIKHKGNLNATSFKETVFE